MVPVCEVVELAGDSQASGNPRDARARELGCDLFDIVQRKHRIAATFDHEVTFERARSNINRPIRTKVCSEAIVGSEPDKGGKRRRKLHYRSWIKSYVWVECCKRLPGSECFDQNTLFIRTLPAGLHDVDVTGDGSKRARLISGTIGLPSRGSPRLLNADAKKHE